MPRLVERLGCTSQGSITGIMTVLVENDDISDPVADSARSLLDGHIVLSRKLADRGHYPAVDILSSISRLMPFVVTETHKNAARKLKEIYATYVDAEDLINIGVLAAGNNRRIDGAVTLIDRIRQFLIQSTRSRTSFAETVKQLTAITDQWESLLNADLPENKKST
jgi:flagellum-specific ATP synthase